ncbi:MAG: hypothetical protein ACYTXC_23810 [Nostoc sp.]
MKKLLLLLLDSLNSGSNKNLADLDDDEKWLARTYFPMLIAESESSPEDALKHVAEVATIFNSQVVASCRQFFWLNPSYDSASRQRYFENRSPCCLGTAARCNSFQADDFYP